VKGKTILGLRRGTNESPLITIANCLALKGQIQVPKNATVESIAATLASILPPQHDKESVTQQLIKMFKGWEDIIAMVREYI
jgi:hypothetical protein